MACITARSVTRTKCCGRRFIALGASNPASRRSRRTVSSMGSPVYLRMLRRVEMASSTGFLWFIETVSFPMDLPVPGRPETEKVYFIVYIKRGAAVKWKRRHCGGIFCRDSG